MKIGIIGAMHEEIVELKTSMTDINEIEISNLKFYEGKLCSKDVVLVESGIGKVSAAISTTLLISNFKVDKIIFTGMISSKYATNYGQTSYTVFTIQKKEKY